MKSERHIFMVHIESMGYLVLQKSKYTIEPSPLNASFWKTSRGAKLAIHRFAKMAPKNVSKKSHVKEKILSITDI